MEENNTKLATYTITVKETGESFKVLPHTFGNGYVDFAKLADVESGEWFDKEEVLYRFDNPNKNGVLSSDLYTIVLDTE